MIQNWKKLSFDELDVLADLPRFKSLRSLARSRKTSIMNISRLVHGIENKIKVVLIRSSHSGIALTQEGISWSYFAVDLLKDAERIASGGKIGESEEDFQKRLVIGGRSFLNVCFSAQLASGDTSDLAGTKYCFLDMSPDELTAAFQSGLIDVGIFIGNLPTTQSWKSAKVGTFDWAFYARKGHSLSYGATVQQIRKYPFTVPAFWLDKKVITGSDRLSELVTEKIRGHECQNAFTAIRIIQATDHIACLPSIVAKEALENGLVCQIPVVGIKAFTETVSIAVNIDRVSQNVFKALQQRLIL